MKLLYRLICVLGLILSGWGVVYGVSADNKVSLGFIKNYKEMSVKDLSDKADSFLNDGLKDSALIYYRLVYNRNVDENDTVCRKTISRAFNKASAIYFHNCDYQTALELLLRALSISESLGDRDYMGKIYNNIGNIHCSFKEYKTAHKYYKLAYETNMSNSALNNLGIVALYSNKFDSALLIFRQIYNEKIEKKDRDVNGPLNNIGLVYQALNKPDEALYYFRRALSNAKELKLDKSVSRFLANIGRIHFEENRFDSAVYYFEASNVIAERDKMLDVASENYLYFSKVEDVIGNPTKSLYYYKKYSDIKDSMFDVSKYGSINQMQFLYDMSKVDKQINELNLEQQLNENTILSQRRFQMLLIVILGLVVVFLMVLYVKNNSLNRAYTELVQKNLEVVNSNKSHQQVKEGYEKRLEEDRVVIKGLQDRIKLYETDLKEDLTESESRREKYKSSSLNDDSKNELANSILKLMEDKSIFCDPEFSLNSLSEMIDSNPNYVSRIINDAFKKNFRSFINEYRIVEARKMLSDPDYKKYSIESIAMMVGFKSRSSFDITFKEFTGVTASFYAKSLKNSE